MEFFQDNVALITSIALALLAISEVLANVPAIKSNSIFQLLTGWLKLFVKK